MEVEPTEGHRHPLIHKCDALPAPDPAGCEQTPEPGGSAEPVWQAEPQSIQPGR